ncbi:MAG: hypothetical protein IJL02_05490 [Methanobrevibacter sp.]|uniref:hypothetical protein n=1 Tax=Methanobrevibacter sp. TaxID=66852 RepID=UPI0025F47DB1|nr:hypothetical protein [Methanobrevibacter sp.]MBQ6099300.1 hypothetical protein [Methanobrevibacter sp.]
MAEKSMIIAIILSIIWSGLGLIYAGDMNRGVMLAVLALVLELLALFVFFPLGIVVFIIWIYSLYATYTEVKAING